MDKIEHLFLSAHKLQQSLKAQGDYLQSKPIDVLEDAWMLAQLQASRKQHQNILKSLAEHISINQTTQLESGLTVALKQDDNGRLSVEIIE